jgi:hypothetical protein
MVGIYGNQINTFRQRLVDINSLDMVRPRSVAIEHVCLEALRKLGLDSKLDQLAHL